ncbi:methyl-accepting chemotaxis protein [Gayadomonas joobiniege]|uniref:methyl-accepting chemotaxis protein n=1 Tax=Gayadomonas joobiniege TaxID=1234606 RepID=UPI00037CDB02|nr:HAMP domain-containing methyl-accepting chemotaxis protein [Gayadomonas joobiniege]
MSFKNLSIKKKIHAITSIAVIAFVAIVAINYQAIDDNQDALNELEKSSYQVVKLTSSNVTLLEKLDELYTQAVTYGEQDLLDKASTTGKKIEQNLNSINQIHSDYISPDSQNQLKEYSNISAMLANAMLSNTADFSKIQQQAQSKTQLYESLLADFKLAQDKADDRFFNLVQATKARSQRALNLMLVVAFSSFILLIIAAVLIARGISASAGAAANNLKLLADGRGSLSTRLEVHANDEIGRVSNNFNAFITLLKAAVVEVISVCTPLMENSTRLVQGMERAEEATSKQAADAEVVKQSMEEMRQSVSEISQSAANASRAAQTAEQEVAQSRTQIERTMAESHALSNEINSAATTINKLAEDTKNVGQILNVITAIAEQTNLLALNAAIEAARAGEQGRGFAVVADEVRELASRTAQSTNEIRELINTLTSAAAESVNAMTSARDMATNNAEAAESTGQSIEKISEQILQMNGMNAQIATATEQQTNVASVVLENVSNMHISFEQTMDSLSAVRDVAENLHQLSDSLLSATDKFKVE